MITTTATQDSAIKIVLNDSDHAQDFRKDNLLHKKEFRSTFEHIENFLDQAKAERPKLYLHNTITLLGSRGSGKTSFLLSIINEIKNATDGKLSRIQVLNIIDPTLIEEKGHVFLNVIALIENLVDQKLDSQECNPLEDKTATINRKDWRSSLNDLAAGLPSIDGIGSPVIDGWQDPEFVMDNGLKAVGASQKLSANFSHFLKISLDILRKDAFLLVFDDIDVDSSKGWTVLETIRKYFTGSRLITLISGDLELYTSVVRQQKWKHFGREILKYEGELTESREGLSEFRKQITKLSAQYMLKIMQPKYRIHLNTLLYRKNTSSLLNVTVACGAHTEDQNIENAYEEIFRQFGIRNVVQVEVFKTFMLSQPLRSQIQFLSLLLNARTGNEAVDNISFADIFLADLLEEKIDVSIASSTPKYLVIIILKFLLKQRKLEDLYQLQPTTVDDGLNASLFALNLLLSNTIKRNSSFVVFDYFIRIGYLRNLLTVVSYEKNRLPGSGVIGNIEDLCERAGLLNDGVLRDSTGKVQSYLYGVIRADKSMHDTNPYFCRLGSLKKSRRRSFTDRIDVVLSKSEVNKASKILGFIPSFAATFSHKNESRIAYSVYMLISSIGEVVKEYQTVIKESHEDKATLMKRALKELSQLRNYPIVDFGNGVLETSQKNEVNTTESVDEAEVSTDNSDILLCSAILEWLEKGDSIVLASHLLGKISTRFFFAMDNISESSTKDSTLGDLFHRQVVAFMNAVLIEEVRENVKGGADKISLNNIKTGDRTFVNNIKNVNEGLAAEEKAILNLSRWLLCCPLLLGYLKNDESSRLREYLKIFTGYDDNVEGAIPLSVSTVLDQISLRSKADQADPPDTDSNSELESLLDNPEELTEYLKSKDAPFEWFVQGKHKGETGKKNKKIQAQFSSIFGNNNQSSGKIRDFRQYLEDNEIQW